MRLINQRNVTKVLLAVTLALMTFWGVFFRNGLAAHVTLTWSYDYGPMPACSVAHVTDCVDHFEILDITDQKSRVVAPAGNPKIAIGKVGRISADFKYGPPFGRRTLSVVAVGRDRNGARVSSNPQAARVTVFIRPFFRLPTWSHGSKR